MSQEIQFITDKFINEKQTLVQQLQQLQAKLYQEKQSAGVESTQKLQQLTEAHQALIQENLSKNHIIADLQAKFHQYQAEIASKINEYDQKLQEFDHIIRQRGNELSVLSVENQRLVHVDNSRKKEFEKMLAMQKYEVEQLKVQVAEQNNKTNHLDDSSKVEIRNLQNALDSSKKELNLYTSDIKEQKAKLDDQARQIIELKANSDAGKSQIVQQTKEVCTI